MNTRSATAQSKGGRTLIFIILAGSFTLCQFLRSAFAVIAPEMAQEAALSARDLGIITSTFFFAVAAMQLPAGVLFDRYGVRYTAALTLGVGVIGGFIFARGESFGAFVLGQLLLGLGTGGLFMGSVVLIGRWWPAGRFAAMSGLLMSCGYSGNLLATTPLAWLSQEIGWRWALQIIVVLLGVSALLIGLVVRDAPPGHAWSQRQPEKIGSIIRGIGEVLRNPVTPGLFAAAFIGYSTTFAMRGLWLGPYMLDVHGLSAIARGNYLLLFSALGSIGIFVAGYAAGRMGNPRPVVIGCSLVTLVTLIAMVLLRAPPEILFVPILSIFALVSNFYPAVLAHGQGVYPERLRGRSLTTVNLAEFLCVGFTQIASGYIINAFADEAGGAHPEIAYRWMFVYLAATVALGVAIYAAVAKFHRRGTLPATPPITESLP